MTEQSVASAAAAPPGSVHELLRQLVESHFVLTDREGAVTRWSAPAQALFGWEAHGILGRPLLETLGVNVAPPRNGGRLAATLRLRDGREIETELVFIPVRMSQSLEFNGFLSALEQMSATALSVERLRDGHYGVVDWIEASMSGQGELAEDELAAGTIVTFRPPAEFYEDQRGDESYEELDDFEDIERALAGTATSVEEARTDAAAARSEAAVASERVGTLEAQGERLREQLEQTQALVETLRGQLEQTHGATVDELREGLDKVRKRVRQAAEQDFGAQIETLRQRLDEARSNDELESQIEALRGELSVLRANATEDAGRDAEALQQLITEVEGHTAEARKAAARVEEAAARAGAHAQTATAVGEQIEQQVARVEEVATATGERAESIRAASTAMEEQIGRAETAAGEGERQALRVEEAATAAETKLEAAARRAEEAAAAAERHLEEAREAAEHAAVEAEVARVQAEAAQTRPRRRSRPAAPTGAGNGKSDLHAPLFGREEDKGPERDLRTGFDDVKEPMATIGLDGHFRELNKPFSELVGYQEKEFAACTWPPVMDRPNLPKHREQMRALLAGESTSVEVNTGYVHAQGLLVPIVGTLSLRRTDGAPDHFLLELVRP